MVWQRHRRVGFLAEVGGRVRALREAKGLSQKGLAEKSGVSPRYLAQLEGGGANLSIERLGDLAAALEVEPAALIDSRPQPSGRSAARGQEATALRTTLDTLLDGRDLGELREVRRWLEARFARRTAPVVALLGLRGAGKSTVGKKLAARLRLRFVELDGAIERAAGLTLAEIFELHGESYYRRLERETLMALLAEPEGLVLATGGSIVNDRETYRLLRRKAVTVWLRASPEDHWNRVLQQGDQRPMAKNPHAMAELRALLAARERLYAEAEHVVDTSRTDIAETVDTLARELGWQPRSR
ncbi:MAG TPA: shikimate kinase [Polyangia bacterium]|jgi:XRE family aerobic/anaerobic benzoate catabolism transcriptional regulator